MALQDAIENINKFGANPSDVLRDALADLGDLQENERRKPRKLCDVLPAVRTETNMRAEGKRKMVALPWPDLNRIHGGGLRPGVHILTGGTGVGKTGYALRVALEAAKSGIPVLYAGLELDNVSVTARWAAQIDALTPTSEGGACVDRGIIPWNVFDWPRQHGDLTKPMIRERFESALRVLGELPVMISDPPAMGWTVDDLKEEIDVVRDNYGEHLKDGAPVLVVLDFLQLIGPTDHPDDRDLRGRIRRASYMIRQYTRENDVCALVVSSVARNHYKDLRFRVVDGDEPKRPIELVGLGKESGEVEFSAHSVTTLCGDDSFGAGGVWAVVAKNRTGLCQYAALKFAGAGGYHVQGDTDARECAADINANLTRSKAQASRPSTSRKPADSKGSPSTATPEQKEQALEALRLCVEALKDNPENREPWREWLARLPDGDGAALVGVREVDVQLAILASIPGYSRPAESARRVLRSYSTPGPQIRVVKKTPRGAKPPRKKP